MIKDKIRITTVIMLLLIGIIVGKSSLLHSLDARTASINGSSESDNRTMPSSTSFPTPKLKFANLVSHSPILIDGNEDFHNQAVIEKWDSQGTRDGTRSNPYVISGYEINDNTECLITIRNTTLHFIICGNELINSSSIEGSAIGIECINVTNGVIANNFIQGSYRSSWGLWCENASLNIVNNTISGFGLSIIMSNCSAVQILNNTLIHNPTSIYIVDSSNNIIANNSLIDSYLTIGVSEGLNSSPISNNTICSNIIHDFYMAFIIGSHGENNTILNNTISEGAIGIALFSACNYLLKGNIIFNVETSAIHLRSSSNELITAYNCISNNVIHHCGIGIALENSQNNIIIKNLIFDQKSHGTRIYNEEGYPPGSPSKYEPSSYNNITDNIYYNNTGGDLALYPNTAENIVIMNKFLATTSLYPHVLDNGSNNIIAFNYYAEWPSWDQNHDEIVDFPYPIAGSANNSDPCPLVSMNTTIDISMFTNNSFWCPTIHTSSSDYSFLKSLGIRLLIAIPIFLLTYYVIRKKK